MRLRPLCFLLLGAAAWGAPPTSEPASPTAVWSLAAPGEIGAWRTEVAGAPRALAGNEGGPGIWFDGVDDGLWLATNPLAEHAQFTVEVLIRPDVGGPEEQRYFHAEDTAGSRVLLELRMLEAGRWCLDGFLKAADAKLVLIDRAKGHAAGRWTWVALRYDGVTASAWVDGVPQGEGTVAFPAMRDGRTSLGVRMDRRSWYRGAIREVRVSREALPAERLQRAWPSEER